MVKLNLNKDKGLNSINGIKIRRVVAVDGKLRLRKRGMNCGRIGMRKICISGSICIGSHTKNKESMALLSSDWCYHEAGGRNSKY